jgi:beta-fructofuranosidase
VTFSLPDQWVWDFWIADDGERFHAFYLRAPKSLGDPELRHRNATIGHATSDDLVHWEDRGVVITPGAVGLDDETATWTGSVVRGSDGLWRMFYTGSRFLSPAQKTNIETVVVAESADLEVWTTRADAACRADPRWYETLGDATWHEEAWRDPWIFQDPEGDGWHMLITARIGGAVADDRDRGVIGHARSADLVEWEVRPPLSAPGAGFAHLEVLQYVTIDGRDLILFSCDTGHLAGDRASGGQTGGVWAVAGAPTDPDPRVDLAELVIGEELYAGRAVQRRDGSWVLLGFENAGGGESFVGRLSDPLPLRWSPEGRLRVERAEAVR